MPSGDLSHATFRPVPRTGVIYVMAEATRHGYQAHDPGWANLGQGQPEAGALPGAPARVQHVPIDVDDHEYAPVAGLPELREAVAELYNTMYRRGRRSRYTADNVAICGGGRLGLTRAAAALGQINLGHFLPDYTAYEELLDVLKNFTAIPILLDAAQGYTFSAEDMRREVTGRGLSALLLSNPANPTGKLIAADVLQGWVDNARQLHCTLLVDEFYSNYIWRDVGNITRDSLEPALAPAEAAGIDNIRSVSAAAHVHDVDRDPVVIFNGLTKNWRYPGWRISWVVGPQKVIEAVASAGSFLDGGGSRPLQRAALPLLEPSYVLQETAAISRAFAPKRQMMVDSLRAMGMHIDVEPEGTFYVWANLAQLKPKLRDGMAFFRAALQHQVIVVPGEFFDVNPGKRRSGRTARYHNHARFSFGPSHSVVQNGLERLKHMLAQA